MQEHPQLGGNQPRSAIDGHNIIADGVPLVLAATRENLRKGASHIKLAAGGGYASPADPLRGNQFTFDEIKAAVDTAADWGTYVTVHSYHPSAINRAIDAGIKDVGHGQLLDKETLERMAEKDVFLSTQPFTVCSEPQLAQRAQADLRGRVQTHHWAAALLRAITCPSTEKEMPCVPVPPIITAKARGLQAARSDVHSSR